MKLALAIGLGGLAGTLLRAAATRWLNHPGAFLPYGTLAVNLSGALLAGLLSGYISTRGGPGTGTPILTVGFLGGLTTFSSFALETGQLALDGQTLRFALNLLLHNTLGLLAAVGGLCAGKALGQLG